MRRPLLVLSLALAAVAAACSSAAPSWTYAPPTAPPSSQPSASDGASAAPSAAASGAPSAAASDGGQAGGDTVAISALNVAFDQKEASAPADKPFVIAFDNKDAGIPHNVEIKDANGGVAFKGDLVTGPAQATYNVGPLAAGTYQFVCTVHPNMVGTLKVGG